MVTLSALHRFHLRVALATLALFIVAATNAALFSQKFENDRLTLLPEKNRAEGEWHAGLDALKGRRNSGINIEIRENHSSWGLYMPTERAPRIEGKTSDGSPVHFSIGTDAGGFQFDGVVKGKAASGH